VAWHGFLGLVWFGTAWHGNEVIIMRMDEISQAMERQRHIDNEMRDKFLEELERQDSLKKTAELDSISRSQLFSRKFP